MTNNVNNNDIPLDKNKVSEPSFVKRTFSNICKLGLLRYLDYLTDCSTYHNIKYVHYILNGCYTGILACMIELTGIAFKKMLGDRHYFETVHVNNSEKISKSIRIRKKIWVAITKFENLTHRIDCIFSSIIKIRTMREIRLQKVSDLELSIVEVFRKCIIESIPENFVAITSYQLSLKICNKLGYYIPGLKLSNWIVVLEAINRCLKPANLIFTEQEKADKEAAEAAEKAKGN